MNSIHRMNCESGRLRAAPRLIQCLFVICALGLVAATTAHATPVIVTHTGPLQGVHTKTMNEYLGIPYAVPPVGSLRWKPPIPYPRWHGVFEATHFGNKCTQPGGSGAIGSEDCLFLNVYTPRGQEGQNERPLPVMVWIHGGGLTTASSHPYDPAPLVERGVIVVTIDYRLGYLGFFAHPAIDAEHHLHGNYGLMDQQLALRWVHRNIAAFGGDPHRVTIFGQSAGAQSVYSQLASPTAARLFEGAISESGAYNEFQDYFNDIVALSVGETTGTLAVPSGTDIATAVLCSDQTAACLRAVPASKLVEAEPGNVYPFVDGTVLTQTPEAAFASGKFNQVPVISGGNHDESRLFVAIAYDFAGNPIEKEAEYEAAVGAIYGPDLAPYVENVYPYSSYPSGGVALGASETDVSFACPELNSVRLLSQWVPTYAYEFDDENAPPPQDAFGGYLTFPLGAYHTAELQYLFVDAYFFGLPLAPLSPDQQELSSAMVGYWTRFAATGDPNGPTTPTWSPYNPGTHEFQSLIPPTPEVDSTFNSDHLCDSFWNTF